MNTTVNVKTTDTEKLKKALETLDVIANSGFGIDEVNGPFRAWSECARLARTVAKTLRENSH